MNFLPCFALLLLSKKKQRLLVVNTACLKGHFPIKMYCITWSFLYFTICPVLVVEAGPVLPLPFSLGQPVAEPDPVVARVLAHQRGQVALLQLGVDGRQVGAAVVGLKYHFWTSLLSRSFVII